MQLEVDRDQFTYLLDILSSLSKYCLDCQVKNGRIRIRSNNKVALYDIRLKEPWNTLDISIPVLTNFVPLAKLFIPDENDTVNITIDETSITISDKISSIVMMAAKDVQNRYITDEELDKSGFSNRTKLVSFNLSLDLLAKLVKMQKNLFSNVVRVNIEDKVLTLESESKTKVGKIYIQPNIENDVQKRLRFSFITFDYPYADDILVNIYKFNASNMKMLLAEVTAGETTIYSPVVAE